MPTFSLPLNIQDDPRKILIDAVNFENQTQLDHTDFEFSKPQLAFIPHTDVNTRIYLTPKIGTNYYNTRQFFYERMDIGNIFTANPIYLFKEDKVLLSELIPEINQFYGINLTEDDYIDQVLPVEDPQNPQALLSVALQITQDSVLFQGVAMLPIDQAAIVPDTDRFNRRSYLVVDSTDPSIYTNQLLAYDTNFQKDEDYQVLSNCTNVLKFEVSKITALANGNIAMRGDFRFTSEISGSSVDYVVATIILGSTGKLVSVGDDESFGPSSASKWSGYYSDTYRYIIDHVNALSTRPNTRLYRYDQTGQLDSSWNASGINYVPTVVTTDKLGRVYTFSSAYLDGGWKIRGDRLKPDGSIDNTFTPIIFTATGSAIPLPISQIAVNASNELFVMIKPDNGVSSLGGEIPIINTIPVVPGGVEQQYGYTPVFKFKENGQWDRTFVNEQKNLAPTALYDNHGSNLSVNDQVLSVQGQHINFLTHIQNPITGFKHRTPLALDKTGKVLRLSGVDYETQIRWVTTKNMVGLTNGNNLIYGTALLRNPAGGWLAETGVAALYYSNGIVKQVIHASTVQAGTALTVRDCAVVEQEY